MMTPRLAAAQIANTPPGVFHQAGLPSAHVLLLPLQHDCRAHSRRVLIIMYHLMKDPASPVGRRRDMPKTDGEPMGYIALL